MTINAQGLTREFTRRVTGTVFIAVKPVGLRVECGELVLLKGYSGSGRSTLVPILVGVLTPTTSRVLLNGEDLYFLPGVELSSLRNEKIGLVPQGYAVLHSLSVVENVILPAVLSTKRAVGPERGLEFLETAGVSALADASPNELSSRGLRHMGAARALMMDPKVVLADEPTAGLDEENAVMVLEMLRHVADEGRAVAVATHEEEATRSADRVLHMVRGCLREDGGRQGKDRTWAEGGASRARVGLQIREALSARAGAGRAGQGKGALRARAGARIRGRR